MTKRQRPTAAVVGAGISGLGAAGALARSGFAVAVFERDEVPGGRARSERVEGFALEASGPLLSTGDRALHGWIDEVGLRDEALPLRPVVTHHVCGRRVADVDPRSLLGIGRIPGIRPRDSLRLPRLPRLISRYGDRLDPEAPERSAGLDDRSLGDFGRLYFGRRVLAHYLAPFVTGASLGDAEELSRVLFLRRFREHAWERPGVLRAPQGDLVEAAASRLAVKCGAAVVRIERGEGGAPILVVRERGAERAVRPDAVVVATSAREASCIAAPVLESAERDALAAVRYQPAISLAVGLRRPFHPHPLQIQLPHGDRSPLESVLLEPGVPAGRVPDGRGLALLRATAAWSEANLDLPAEIAEKELLAAFGRLHAGAHSAVLFKKLFRVEHALPRFEVGHYRRIARLESVGEELRREGRRVYFAGDYLMEPSLNGALVSARRAAAQLVADQVDAKRR